MSFEVFTRGQSTPASRAAGIRITESQLVLNTAAKRLIGSPKTVELLIDRVDRKIALRPGAETDFKVSATGAVSSKPFVTRFHLPAGFYPVELVGDMLVATIGRSETGR